MTPWLPLGTRYDGMARRYLHSTRSQSSYLVMEYLGGGEIKWRNEHHQPVLQVDQCRRICRDVILGLEYRVWFLLSASIHL